MNKYNRLLEQIATLYSIRRGDSESINDWKIRIIYSMLGQMALASLRDTIEEGEPSVVHVKRRIDSVLNAYHAMYPELHMYFPDDTSIVSNEIYNIFNSTGYFYHKAHHVSSTIKTTAIGLDIAFTRGYELEAKHQISGLGTYITSTEEVNYGTVERMFQLNRESLKKIWNECLANAKWREFSLSNQKVEFLRMSGTFTRGYWVNDPEEIEKESILRVGMPGNWIYYLYKKQKEDLVVSQLPAWKVEKYQYRLLSNACLLQNNILPPTRFRYDGELVYFEFGYLPSPQELNFWKLYTWPTSIGALPSDFSRVCTKQVFESVKAVMMKQGYEFIEEVKR